MRVPERSVRGGGGGRTERRGPERRGLRDADLRGANLVGAEPGRREPGRRGPERSGPGMRGPERSVPGMRGPERSVPGRSVPGRRGPERSVPGMRGPERRGPERSVPGRRGPERREGIVVGCCCAAANIRFWPFPDCARRRSSDDWLSSLSADLVGRTLSGRWPQRRLYSGADRRISPAHRARPRMDGDVQSG